MLTQPGCLYQGEFYNAGGGGGGGEKKEEGEERGRRRKKNIKLERINICQDRQAENQRK